MKSQELEPTAQRIVKELSKRLNAGQIGPQDEQRIVEFVNWVGDLIVREVVEGVEEPTRANRTMVDGEAAVFEQVRQPAVSSIASGTRGTTTVVLQGPRPGGQLRAAGRAQLAYGVSSAAVQRTAEKAHPR